MRWLLHNLVARLSFKVIEHDGEPLFERYLVCRLSNGSAIYIHHYLRSDPDRGLHDHPWRWAAVLILAGGYNEDRMRGFGTDGPNIVRNRRLPGCAYWLTGSDFHSLLIADGRTSWSLFAHGPYRKPWGFLRPTRAESGRVAWFYERAKPYLEIDAGKPSA